MGGGGGKEEKEMETSPNGEGGRGVEVSINKFKKGTKLKQTKTLMAIL